MVGQLKHILSSRQFDIGFFDTIFRDTEIIERMSKTFDGRRLLREVAPGSRMGTFFWQLSSRTKQTSHAGIEIIGGTGVDEHGEKVIRADGTEDYELAFTSAMKGAYLEDEFLAFAFCRDLLVLRTHRPFMPHEAASVIDDYANEFDMPVHVINAGDATNEHPTQTLNDVYTIFRALNFTIREDFSKLKNYSIAFINDCRNSRTIHSLALKAGIDLGMTLQFIAPPGLEMPRDFLDELERAGVKFSLHTEFQRADFYYVTRLQKEYGLQLEHQEKFDEYINYYRITQQVAEKHEVSFVMHPFPRSKEYNELPRRKPDDSSTWDISLDKTPKALYFKQMKYSAPIKAALFKYLLNPEVELNKLDALHIERSFNTQCLRCLKIWSPILKWSREPYPKRIETYSRVPFCEDCEKEIGK